MNAEAIEQLDCALSHPAVVELWNDTEKSGAKLAAQKHVLRNVERIDETEALMKAADSGRVRVAGGAEPDRLAFDLDAAGVRRLSAGQRLDQGGLSRPVVADQGQDLTAMDIDRR